MKTVVFAYHDMGCVGIEALLNANYDIQAVFTHRDDPNENCFFNSVAKLCAEHVLPVFDSEDVNLPFWVEHIKQYEPDIIFSFYYRKILTETILNIPRHGAFNLHGSLLPAYRGCAPVNWVLINGEKETGVTLHRMIKRVDSGDIVAQHSIMIDDNDDAKTLHQKICFSARELLSETLPKIITNNITLMAQNEMRATYFGRRNATDGELNWQQPARSLYNLVRAVTQPYPGAFSFAGDRKLFVWRANIAENFNTDRPGTIISTDPLRIACGEGALEIIAGQEKNGLYMRGAQLAHEMRLIVGMHLGVQTNYQKPKSTRVLILGVNGFIGNHLTERLLKENHYEIFGFDINSHGIQRFINHPRFHMMEGDVSIHSEWIEHHIKKCDIILPLVAIATPIEYIRNPLGIFELDFEENLKIVRYCVKYNKRIIFPSSSEVYGVCTDKNFDEDKSNLIVGPINKQRWIYSVSKQLLDRIIWAYGKKGLRFSIFRPFNWIGPRLDNLKSARIGNARVITQLILNLVTGTPMQLIDGGAQKRCFTDINDGIEALFQIIENKNERCNGEIINIGNPDNEVSIRELAKILLQHFEKHPLRSHFPPFSGIKEVEHSSFYGHGYQDILHRRPSIHKAQRLFDWKPTIPIEISIANTLHFFLKETIDQGFYND